MKKLFILIFFIPLLVSSQVIDIFPKDKDNKIHFEQIKNADGKSSLELYTKAKLFFVNNFVQANSVIQMDDKELGIIVGNGNSTIKIQSGKYEFPFSLNYTVKIECKDNKYKYSIYNLSYGSKAGGNIPAEFNFNSETEEKYKTAKEKYKKIMESYRDQTKEKIDQLELLINKAMLENDSENSKW